MTDPTTDTSDNAWRTTPRESMAFDVVVVGAGPAGLAAAIRLKQLNSEISVCVVEKASEVGAHILSGCVLEPRAFAELLPEANITDIEFSVPAGDDRFLFLTEKSSYKMPTPPQMHNHGNYVVSLGNVVRFLGAQAEALGVEIYPGFAAAEILTEAGRVIGVATGDMGIGKEGQPTELFQRGMELHATYTVFAEGCRGSLGKQLIATYGLNQGVDPQTYGIGIKELWEVPAANHHPGMVMHSIGWPMDRKTYGGSFLYHLGGNLMAYGFVVGLDYENPYFSPFEEMQRFKTHPAIRPFFEGAKRISYGARALNEGGFQSIPKLIVPGGVLVGCEAGFLNVPKIKGTHTAMKSGMLAAEAIADALAGAKPDLLEDFPTKIRASWLWPELESVRNIRPGFAKFGLFGGLMNAAFETYITRGKSPWTLNNHADNTTLKPAAQSTPIAYPKPDGKLTFDRLSSVFISNTNHEENQPAHLTLRNPDVAISVNWAQYRSPETRYCPAGVYEIIGADTQNPRLQINAQNCVHCKTCDIKDPTQNINWVTPEGSGGPNYPGGM
ncbi:MAG TPA: electron transfer flavoprotein-ubiquinone oxidoreductase [Acidiphilium sp.]|nr:MAG: electron transfer flavoprotein-ubiquinone oxidoreductase [Acidiphilium sp. 21-60-14]OYV91414.1 MAG: electron transfer flavoprotein-ubiquinone oxidoreductase [Acidiphilium sp. 37-60-79]OZB41407.1 MAG: electron transfer flavoprotein-ubiquinone oxidoreductase [Acidiphilium sp. 34-60-192]HQT87253.1 electron transfer flavoprotein-ubiquinone oxidoreductase [Acidiphilium sp.]HQU23180.1 electron transfer flavoprotein-ubiquinone oxidoreductase [Acidiphilium sp.]